MRNTKIIMELDKAAREALRNIQAKNPNTDDCGGILVRRPTAFRNRKKYDRRRFKRGE